MDLLNVLKLNGTGLLEGLCRLEDRDNSFTKLKIFDKVRVNFSLGVENLCTYEVKVNSIDDMVLNCTITETENEGMGVQLRIIIKDVGDFGRFEAFDYR